MDFITVPFGYLMEGLYALTVNYGWSLILFGVILKLVLAPTTAKSKKSSMKMARLQPRVKLIQEKFANDPQKQNQEIQALYKAENVSMGAGCLWSLLPLLIIFPLFSVIREPLEYILHMSETEAEALVDVAKKLGAIDPGTYYGQMAAAQNLPELLANPDIVAKLAEMKIDLSAYANESVNFMFLGLDLGADPTWHFWTAKFWKGGWATIGLTLLPVLSAGIQVVSMLINTKINNSLVVNEKGVRDKEAAKNSQVNKSNKTMMIIGPAMSLLIGFSYPAALSLYWLTQGAAAMVIDVVLTLKYRKIYDAEDAARIAKLVEEERAEMERERIRAERRAANPDGQTQNTSKKKLQKQQQQNSLADKAAAAREYAIKKGELVEEEEKNTAMSGIPDRPYCKGRAYDPNRYQKTEE